MTLCPSCQTMSLARALTWLVLLAFASVGHAQNAVLSMRSFPTVTVADGRSTVTVTITIRDSAGKNVPNGTPVVLSSTLGQFRETNVVTTNGVAQGILVAGSIPGLAKVTATALTVNATGVYELELVGSREDLSSAREFIEVVSPTDLVYGVDQRMIDAAALNGGVSVRYRDILIEADHIQLDVPTYMLRARKATVKTPRFTHKFDELWIKLNDRQGQGVATLRKEVLEPVPMGRFTLLVPRMRERFGMVDIRPSGVDFSTEAANTSMFEFLDVSENAATISATRAVAFPRREVQFQRATIFVGQARVVKLPLFQVSLYGQTPILTDQVVNVYNNQLAINYPHFLSLRPGQTSLLRFRAGDTYGRGYSTTRGTSIDYELNWNKGDDMEGGLTVSGLARSDWGIGARQYWRFDERTSMNFSVEMPGHRSLLGSGNVSRQFNGYQASLSASSTRSLRGTKFESSSASFVLEKDPIKLGTVPVRFSYGLSATQTDQRSDLGSRSQSAAGLRGRFQMTPQALDRSTTLNASLVVSRQFGHNTLNRLATVADFSMSRTLAPGASTVISYNFTEDGFSSSFAGRHSLSGQLYYGRGRTQFSGFLQRSLDLDRFNAYADASYRLHRDWRLAYSYTYSRYLGDGFLDYNAMVAYRLGSREFGLLWSNRTRRIGFQVLGATFD